MGATMPNRIVWCDIPVTDLDRAISFYSAILGETVMKVEFSNMKLGMLPDSDTDVSGCLYVPSGDNKPATEGPLVYFNCLGRLDAAEAEVETHGGKVLQAKHQIGPYGFRVVALDSEGNRIALHSK
jgi:predicted enzyme related to lactoylglutathione lyase